MLEELKQTWENALMQLLQKYQEEHPEDKDLQNAMNELEGKPAEAKPAASSPYKASAPSYKAPAPAKNAKTGIFTLAG